MMMVDFSCLRIHDRCCINHRQQGGGLDFDGPYVQLSFTVNLNWGYTCSQIFCEGKEAMHALSSCIVSCASEFWPIMSPLSWFHNLFPTQILRIGSLANSIHVHKQFSALFLNCVCEIEIPVTSQNSLFMFIRGASSIASMYDCVHRRVKLRGYLKCIIWDMHSCHWLKELANWKDGKIIKESFEEQPSEKVSFMQRAG